MNICRRYASPWTATTEREFEIHHGNIPTVDNLYLVLSTCLIDDVLILFGKYQMLIILRNLIIKVFKGSLCNFEPKFLSSYRCVAV